MSDFPQGSVWLVGAGPGDPELLTRKAERLIRTATIIFYDALVGPEVLSLAQKDTTFVHVGKRAGHHSKDQKTISSLLVQAALSGQKVLRLKGGDPSIFGRAMEELDACHDACIPVHICPGITAASAAAASLGKSLTLRGHARKLMFLTAHARDGQPLDIDWGGLADSDASLAVYMGKSSATLVMHRLLAAGMRPSTPVALAENVSLPSERTFRTRLDLLSITAKADLGSGPVIILIGKAFGLEAPVRNCHDKTRSIAASPLLTHPRVLSSVDGPCAAMGTFSRRLG